MKIIEVRNKHFQKVFKDIRGMKLGISNAGFFNVIYVDMEEYKEFETIGKQVMCLVGEQNLHLTSGDGFGAQNLMRFDNCLNIDQFTDMVCRLTDFSKNHV